MQQMDVTSLLRQMQVNMTMPSLLLPQIGLQGGLSSNGGGIRKHVMNGEISLQLLVKLLFFRLLPRSCPSILLHLLCKLLQHKVSNLNFIQSNLHSICKAPCWKISSSFLLTLEMQPEEGGVPGDSRSSRSRSMLRRSSWHHRYHWLARRSRRVSPSGPSSHVELGLGQKTLRINVHFEEQPESKCSCHRAWSHASFCQTSEQQC